MLSEAAAVATDAAIAMQLFEKHQRIAELVLDKLTEPYTIIWFNLNEYGEACIGIKATCKHPCGTSWGLDLDTDEQKLAKRIIRASAMISEARGSA